MMLKTSFAAAAALAALAFASSPAEARSQIISCGSGGYSYNYCPIDTRGGVDVYRQKSSSPCEYGSTWGYDRRGIWVDQGCRADFIVGAGHAQDNYDPYEDDYYPDSGNGSGGDIGAGEAIGAIIALGIIAAILEDDEEGRRDRGYGRADAVKACANYASAQVRADGGRSVTVDEVYSVTPRGRRKFEVEARFTAKYGRRDNRRYDIECTVRNGSVTSFNW
ncbi:MAG TPA: DUF3011 domain-containing protein [Micropepsaceae bacterium]|nr:DUF3011 domain-containing protein [Micropepsaceae bacterium]